MTRKILLFFLLIAAALFLPATSGGQQANLRQNYPGGWNALRPDTFHIRRTGVVPVTASLETLTELGEFVDKNGVTPQDLPPKLWLDGREYPCAATMLAAACDGRRLLLVVRCDEPEPELMAESRDDYYDDDRVVIDLDLDHDHRTFQRIEVWPWGVDTVSAHRVTDRHLAWDRRVSDIPAWITCKATATRSPGGWIARVELELPGGVECWRALGFNVQRYRGVRGEEISMWCPDFNRPAAPLYFGDLYLGAPPATISAVELGEVAWGENRGCVTFGATGAANRLDVETRNYMGAYRSGSFDVDNNTAAFDWYLDPHDIMYGELRLSLDGAYWGSYQFGWQRSILLTHRPTGRFEKKKPAPGAADYYWEFVSYVLDRLPHLERSRDGTVLTDGAGISIDLTGPDPLGELAAVVMNRFATDEERLTAATMLLCQQGVMVSARIGEQLAHQQNGVGALRVGGAFCNSYGELLRDLVRRIQDHDGNYFEACVVHFVPGAENTFGWPHHWLCGVKYGGGLTLIDSELGTVFFDPATGRLATLQQLIANPDLAELTAYGLSEFYRGRKLEEFMVREDGDLLR